MTTAVLPVWVLVTGSRTWDDDAPVFDILDGMFLAMGPALTVVHGACPRGADAIAEAWCVSRGVAVQRFPADWAWYGDAAGPIRNRAMVANANRCLAFIRDGSRGATGCAALAEAAGLPTLRIFWRGGNR